VPGVEAEKFLRLLPDKYPSRRCTSDKINKTLCQSFEESSNVAFLLNCFPYGL
jgi:hypothetical protein